MNYIHITDKEAAQGVPEPVTTYALFRDGEFLTQDETHSGIPTERQIFLFRHFSCSLLLRFAFRYDKIILETSLCGKRGRG